MDFLLETTTNQIFLYVIHFIASFLDAFVFSSFFIAWEVFFVSGGYLSVDYLNFWICYVFMVFGAVIWDNLSYFLGKKYWRNIFLKSWKFLNKNQLDRWEKLLKKHWEKIIFFSRFIWPFYWLIPTFAGTFNVSYKKFFFFDLAWVCIWVLHFMAYWYLFVFWIEYFGTSIFINILLGLLFIYILILFIFRLKTILKEKKYFSVFLLFFKFFIVYFFTFICILAYYFFYLYPIEAKFYEETKILDLEKYISEMDKKIYSDKVIKSNSNPINIVIVTDKNLDDIMEKISRKKNLSFSSSEITIPKFWKLFFKKEPPISDYYHNSFNQNFQYQDFSKSSANRNHIRFWLVWEDNFWKKIYLSSVSEDKNYAFMINNWIPVIWHSIEKNIDSTRDYFISILSKNFEKMEIKDLEFWNFEEKNYFTDGKIIIVFL